MEKDSTDQEPRQINLTRIIAYSGEPREPGYTKALLANIREINHFGYRIAGIYMLPGKALIIGERVPLESE